MLSISGESYKVLHNRNHNIDVAVVSLRGLLHSRILILFILGDLDTCLNHREYTVTTISTTVVYGGIY